MRAPRWLLRSSSVDAEARIFCFPYSGCGASMYHRWPRRIGQVEVCLIQPPGRENRSREPHYGTYEAMASALVDYLPPHLDRPFAFFGHCGGALPAVELAYQLHLAGLPTPARLIVSSQVAPQDGPYGRFLDLDREQLGEELRRLVVALGGRPTDALIEIGLDLLAQDLAANRSYRPVEPRCLPGGITVVGWTRDHEIPIQLMAGWSELSGDCRFVTLDGGHYDFLSAPGPLLAEITRELTAAPCADGRSPAGA